MGLCQLLNLKVLTVVFCGLIYSLTSATLSDRETLLNVTTCNTGNVQLNCGTGVIALDKVEVVYRAGVCVEGVYDDTDCIQDATADDMRLMLRECSGRSSCAVDMDVTRSFCTYGVIQVSYIHVKYYCIDNSRIADVCSTTTAMTSSTGSPLYLTNPGYPSKTSPSVSCSCSLEVQSCSSQVYMYTQDHAFYNNGASGCEQNITITDGSGVTLKSMGCEDFYSSPSSTDTLNSNFMTVTFGANLAVDGFFFIGFAATDGNAVVTLNCQSQAETWCIDCGSVPALQDGSYTLSSDSSYGSTANVNCNQRYDANTTSITCMEQGTWGSAVCTIKDCGGVPSIDNGNFQLANPGTTTYGAVADVTCDTGYTPSTANITCLATGNWQTAQCVDDDKDIGESTDNPKKSTWWIILIVVLVVLSIAILYLVQVIVALCKDKHCNNKDWKAFIPVFGWKYICNNTVGQNNDAECPVENQTANETKSPPQEMNNMSNGNNIPNGDTHNTWLAPLNHQAQVETIPKAPLPPIFSNTTI